MERLSHYRAWSDGRVFGKALAAVGGAMFERVSPQAYAREKLRADADGDEVLANLDAAALTTKAAVGGLDYGSSTSTPAWSSIAQGTFGQTILGQVQGGWNLPFVHQVAGGSITGAGASWRREGAGVRISPVAFAAVALPRRSITGMAVASREFIDLAIRDGSVADTLSRLLQNAIRREVDSVFCGSTAAVANTQPAGIAYNAQTVASTGATAAEISADIRSMISTMIGGGISLRSGAVWILSAEALASLSTLRLLDESGTTLAGRPFVTDAPSGTFLLVAQDFLSYARSDSISIASSTTGMIEMDSAPTGNAVTPTAASASPISLFQSDCVAIRATLDLNWSIASPEDSNGGHFAVVALTGSAYA